MGRLRFSFEGQRRFKEWEQRLSRKQVKTKLHTHKHTHTLTNEDVKPAVATCSYGEVVDNVGVGSVGCIVKRSLEAGMTETDCSHLGPILILFHCELEMTQHFSG